MRSSFSSSCGAANAERWRVCCNREARGHRLAGAEPHKRVKLHLARIIQQRQKRRLQSKRPRAYSR